MTNMNTVSNLPLLVNFANLQHILHTDSVLDWNFWNLVINCNKSILESSMEWQNAILVVVYHVRECVIISDEQEERESGEEKPEKLLTKNEWYAQY